MSDLKNCPFCGSDKVAVGHTNLGYEALCFYYGAGCKSRTGIWPTRTEAIVAWNRRTPVTADAGEVSEAEVTAACMANLSPLAEPSTTERKHMRAALLAARRVQPKQDAPSPDVAGLIEGDIADWAANEIMGNEYLRNFQGTLRNKIYGDVQRTVFLALSHLTPPKQDDARDSTVGAAVNTCAVCGERKATPLRIDSLGGYVCLSCALASARADGVREASKAANEVHEYYAGVRDRTPTGTPAHDVAQECIIASARTWRAVAALLPDQPAAIRALINKDAGGV